jgi:hypothetical protein
LIAGLSHEWRATTPYYSALVPIWIDEFPSSTTDANQTAGIDAWLQDFLRDEARDVVRAVGAWVYVFRKPASDAGSTSLDANDTITQEAQTGMKAIQAVVEKHVEYDEDGVSSVLKLAVVTANERWAPLNQGTASPGKTLLNDTTAQDQEAEEDKCMEFDFEYINYTASGQNVFGEKVGFARLQEALQTTQWTSSGSGHGEDDGDGEDDIAAMLAAFDAEGAGMTGTDREEAEWTAEMFAVKSALHEQGDTDDEHEDSGDDGAITADESQVDDLELLMGRLLAVREQSIGLPEEQRKRMAAQAVSDAVRNLRS